MYTPKPKALPGKLFTIMPKGSTLGVEPVYQQKNQKTIENTRREGPKPLIKKVSFLDK